MAAAIPERNWLNIQWLARLRWSEIAGQALTVLATGNDSFGCFRANHARTFRAPQCG